MLTIGERTLALGLRPRRDAVVLLAQFLMSLNAFQERARQRHALAAFDDRLLADIGLSRAMAEAEAAKPFWKP